jgi:Tfp pilus assembly protein PilX
MDLLRNLPVTVRRRLDLRREDGWVIVIAMALMIIMLGVGLGIASLADTQIKQSNTDRLRESALNLAEGALTAQQYRLPYDWPSSSTKAFPAQCPDTANPTNSQCPTTANLIGAAGLFSSDANGGAEFVQNQPTWVTRVRDNNAVYPASGWNDYTTATDTNARWDSNGDNRMWVRADGWIGRCAATPARTATCKRRSVVGLVNLENFQEQLPSDVLRTGGFTITPNSNQHTYVCVYGVDSQGNCLLSSATGSQVTVRCTPVPPLDPSPSGTCEGYASNQIQPNIVQSGGIAVPPYMPTAQLNRFINSAMIAGTYCRHGVTPGIAGFCPTGNGNCPDFTKAPPGAIVVSDPDSHLTTCDYTGNNTYNVAIFIMTDGEVTFGGQTVFNGIIYHTNGCSPSNPSPNDGTNCPNAFANVGTKLNAQVSIQGTARVNGAISVDGLGFTVLGSSSDGALAFNPNSGGPVTVGAAGLVQSTWRELPANSA